MARRASWCGQNANLHRRYHHPQQHRRWPSKFMGIVGRAYLYATCTKKLTRRGWHKPLFEHAHKVGITMFSSSTVWLYGGFARKIWTPQRTKSPRLKPLIYPYQICGKYRQTDDYLHGDGGPTEIARGGLPRLVMATANSLRYCTAWVVIQPPRRTITCVPLSICSAVLPCRLAYRSYSNSTTAVTSVALRRVLLKTRHPRP